MKRANDTLGMMSSPLVGQVMTGGHHELSEEMITMREEQREHELRLLGTMLFQAFFLSLCILLYERWAWSHFGNVYEAMIFWFTASFALQAGFYFIYRAGFEDSNAHRKSLRRMRQSNKRRLAQLKYNQEKHQLEQVLGQQMSLFQQNLGMALADGVLDQQETNSLSQQAAQLLSTMNQGGVQGNGTPNQAQLSDFVKLMQHALSDGNVSQQQSQQLGQIGQQVMANMQPPQILTPEQAGIGRMDIFGLPIGPSLTLSQPVANNSLSQGTASFQGGPPQADSVLNLHPSGTTQQKEQETADHLEAINESL